MANYKFILAIITAVVFITVILLLSGESAPPGMVKSVKAPQADVFTGDFPAVKQRGVLRILMPVSGEDEDYLPRYGFPTHYERDVLLKFAKRHQIKAQFIYVNSRNQLIPNLLQGKGDVIGANMTITKERTEQVAFSIPIEAVREQIIGSADVKLASIAAIVKSGKAIHIHRSSSFWQTLQNLKKKYPKLKIEAVEESIPTESIVDSVAAGEFPLTVVDSNLMKAISAFDDRVKVLVTLPDSRAIAWAVRPESEKLLSQLDHFIATEQWYHTREEVHKSDWQGIKERKVLRMITRNNAATYFIWRGKLVGFEYELVRRFAKKHNLYLQVIVPPTREDLYQWLQDGRGDLIAASLTINAERAAKGMHFTRFYNIVNEVVVTRAKDKTITDVADLAGRKFYVRRSSAYWQTLENLQQQGIALTIEPVAEDLETEEIIDKVASGEFDLTLSDSHIAGIEMTWRDDIHTPLTLDNESKHGWVVREDAKQLLQQLNKFIKSSYRGTFYNIIHRKYFKNKHTIQRHVKFRVDQDGGKLSPYDDITRRFADQYNFDWRLLTAQMYQESGFDPNAKSWVGALGLMQVMPRTARQLGFNKAHLAQPAPGIHAGTKYLAWLRDQIEEELAYKQKLWFTLAAYNAGLGHMRDARRLAGRLGWDRNVWFGNVEKAMLLLSKPKYAKSARHGYVRGSEPVKYVRQIRDRFNAYIELLAGWQRRSADVAIVSGN